jgi:ribosomal protein S18 acetylase RimI-like enzyme
MSRGFEPRMVETRMVRDATAPVPDVPALSGIETLPWSNRSAPLFFAAYRASFADRPGFPDPPAEQWVEELANEKLHAHVSRVALAAGEPVGFVTARLTSGAGWIDQIGVAPHWRRRGLASALLAAALVRFQTTEPVEVLLHVNANNPRALALFNRIGFRDELRRARYTRTAGRRPRGSAIAS